MNIYSHIHREGGKERARNKERKRFVIYFKDSRAASLKSAGQACRLETREELPLQLKTEGRLERKSFFPGRPQSFSRRACN